MRRYDGPGNGDDIANDIALDDSGNVYVTGGSYGNDGNTDYATIRYYPNGATAWVRRYNGPRSSGDAASAMAVDGSGNVYVTGNSTNNDSVFSREDYATIKYDAGGNQVWVSTYNGPGNRSDRALGLAVDGFGNAYVTGFSYGDDTTEYDYATIKYGASGSELWVERYNPPGNGDDRACGIAVDGSGNVYVTGAIHVSGPFEDYATIKYYPNGGTAWVKTYNGLGNDWDSPCCITAHESGNVYVTGSSTGSWADCDYATIKYYPNGDTAWVRRYDGPGYGDDYPRAIAIDSCENVYVTGKSWDIHYDCATIKYDSLGTRLWVTAYDGPAGLNDAGIDIAVSGSGDLYVTGDGDGGSGTDYDYVTIKYGQCTNVITELDIYDPGCRDKLILCWHPSPDTDVVGYNVHAGSDPEGPFDQINESPLTDTVYLDEDSELYYFCKFYYIEQVTSTMNCRCTNIDSGSATIPVVLVHGWRGAPDVWDSMESWLPDDGFEHVWVPMLNGRGGHSKNADSLNKFIEAKKDSVEDYVESVYGFTDVRPNRINLIAHSMGGIISRLYIDSLGPSVDNLIMAATPNGGNRLATALAWINPFAEAAIKEMSISFMRKFNNDHPNVGEVDYHTIAGDYPVGHWPSCTDEYTWFDPRPNDRVVNVDRVHCTQGETETQITTDKGHDHHNSIVRNYDTYQDFILPLLVPGVTASFSHDFRQSFTTHVLGRSDSLEQLLPTYSRKIYTGEVLYDTSVVDSTQIVRIGIYWFDGEIDLVLYDPYGTLIDSVYAATNDNVIYSVLQDGSPLKLESYGIANPVPGKWILEVTAIAVPDTGETYYTAGAVDSDLRLSAWTDQESYSSGKDATISGRLQMGSFPVTGAMVNAFVLKPDSLFEQVELFDDGAHYDGDANDGVYANLFSSTNLASLYLGTIHAYGSVDEDSFSREAFFGFWVSQAPFMRGDANGDGAINTVDIVYLINYLFNETSAPDPLWVGDANCDGKVDTVDIVYLINYLFGEGPPPGC